MKSILFKTDTILLTLVEHKGFSCPVSSLFISNGLDVVINIAIYGRHSISSAELA